LVFQADHNVPPGCCDAGKKTVSQGVIPGRTGGGACNQNQKQKRKAGTDTPFAQISHGFSIAQRTRYGKGRNAPQDAEALFEIGAINSQWSLPPNSHYRRLFAFFDFFVVKFFVIPHQYVYQFSSGPLAANSILFTF
jgi:hypothetical protein